MTAYDAIPIAGGDTATPLNLRKRLRFLEPYLHDPDPEKGATHFLDCGCGAGEYVHAVRSEYGVEAWGIEYLEEKVAQAHALNPSAEWIQQGNIEALPFPEERFDLVLLNEVLEHVPHEGRALAEIHRVLRSGGRLILFSPNRWFPFETHGVYLRGKGEPRRKVKPYVPFIPYIPLAVGQRFFHYWARNYGQRQLKRIVQRAGFHVERRGFVWQTFENISGDQPWLIRKCRGFLRAVANLLEKTPFLRRFGVSQVLVARKG